MTDAFGIDDIRAAARRIGSQVVRTPVLAAPMLDAAAGCRVLVKAEALQRTGSFKLRGALNAMLALDPRVRARGVIAVSAGNHGHAVAAAAQAAGCSAVIVLPDTAPAIKVANCRWWGAEVVLYDPATQDREAVMRPIAESRGLTSIPPFDGVDVMAGQGTVGLEFAEQLGALGVRPDAFLACCSGGGLAAGAATAIRAYFPGTAVHVVEPAGLDKMARSLACGVPQALSTGSATGSATIMDGIAGPVAGARPLAVLRGCGATGLTVTDAQALTAMAAAFRFLKLVLEPAGAAALAAVLANRRRFAGRTLALVATGGNVDEAVFARALAYDPLRPLRSDNC